MVAALVVARRNDALHVTKATRMPQGEPSESAEITGAGAMGKIEEGHAGPVRSSVAAKRPNERLASRAL